MTPLAQALLRSPVDMAAPTLRDGIVTDDSPCTVQVGAETTATQCPYLSSYTPNIGDKVLVLVAGPNRVVLGKTEGP